MGCGRACGLACTGPSADRCMLYVVCYVCTGPSAELPEQRGKQARRRKLCHSTHRVADEARVCVDRPSSHAWRSAFTPPLPAHRSPWMPTCRTLQTKLVRFIGNCTVRWIQPIQSNLQHRRRWDVALCQCQLWHMYVATPPPLRVRLCRLNAFVSRLNSTARTSDREGCAQRPLHACCTPSAGRISWQQYSSNCSRPITADREVPGQ